jgi:hypothetical protein
MINKGGYSRARERSLPKILTLICVQHFLQKAAARKEEAYVYTSAD